MNPPPLAATHLRFAVQLLRLAQVHLEHTINATPTGKVRGALCDVNIAVMQLITTLEKLT